MEKKSFAKQRATQPGKDWPVPQTAGTICLRAAWSRCRWSKSLKKQTKKVILLSPLHSQIQTEGKRCCHPKRSLQSKPQGMSFSKPSGPKNDKIYHSPWPLADQSGEAAHHHSQAGLGSAEICRTSDPYCTNQQQPFQLHQPPQALLCCLCMGTVALLSTGVFTHDKLSSPISSSLLPGTAPNVPAANNAPLKLPPMKASPAPCCAHTAFCQLSAVCAQLTESLKLEEAITIT